MQEQKNIRGYEVVTWQDVAKQVRAVNSGLADAIDDIDPPSSWKIVKVRYAFGDELLRKGELFVPHNGQLISINDSEFPAELLNLLNYTSMPIGLTTHSTMELFSSYEDGVGPFSFMYPGKIFALWMALDTPFHVKIWNMAAGCRSIFLLPKITDTMGFKRLNREFSTSLPIPNSLWDHWYLLKDIAKYDTYPWFLEALYFGKIWFDQGPKQNQLRHFLLETGWKGTSFLRSDIFFNIIYSHAQEEKNIKIDPYLSDTIKHLYYLGCGSYQGLVLANSDLAGPINFLQTVFNNIYNLGYTPTIMHSNYLTPTSKKNLFYSLQFPTLLEFAPKSQAKATNLDALYYIQHSMGRLKNYILNEKANLSELELYRWANNINYSFYHSHPSEDDTVRPVTELVTEEPILQEEQKKFNKPFCETNSFMRGLIKLNFND